MRSSENPAAHRNDEHKARHGMLGRTYRYCLLLLFGALKLQGLFAHTPPPSDVGLDDCPAWMEHA